MVDIDGSGAWICVQREDCSARAELTVIICCLLITKVVTSFVLSKVANWRGPLQVESPSLNSGVLFLEDTLKE